jgi:hypothetical protein
MTPKAKSFLLQLLLALCLLGTGALLAAVGVRPPCCDPGAGAACPPGAAAEAADTAATIRTSQGR